MCFVGCIDEVTANVACGSETVIYESVWLAVLLITRALYGWVIDSYAEVTYTNTLGGILMLSDLSQLDCTGLSKSGKFIKRSKSYMQSFFVVVEHQA